ncbi:hypothetical protein [Bradyrhizobium sp. NP1]|uniref:hypothetical protein n=1 Tax=Bradyrhizobium sp. NP1 TaxID=3049772 RepID=UPI0025A4EE46|nr:hypothetical protein [Bradyrhizobium sp. NP1]WJR79111.1 hypothetical protein QOU61_04760 [Bradyrhizobium sp. NP1]
MSALSEQGPTTPNDPLHYAPRRLRERTEPSLSSFAEAGRDTRPIMPPTSLDASLENAVYQSLRRSLDPEIVPQPATLARSGRSKALFGAAAIGVSALAALFFVYMVHASQETDAASFAAAVQSMKAPPAPATEAPSASALAEFRGVLTAAQANQQPATHEESEKLLQQFVQWRQKAGTTDTSQ